MKNLNRCGWKAAVAAVVLLALPVLGVHVWMASTFPSYLHDGLTQGVVFTFALCTLLVLVARQRLLHVASVPVALVVYLVWLFLVLGEGVSYYLQADTFNARFFANLNPNNLTTGLRAFPLMIGGGLVVFLVMLVVGIALLVWLARSGQAAHVRRTVVAVVSMLLIVVAVAVNSAPKRFVTYLSRSQQSVKLADTAQGDAVARLIDPHPVPKAGLIAAPGKNVVWLYLESVERTYWDPKVFPGLTPNLDRLRGQGLDFSGFQTYAGATFTIAGMFASQCGSPYLPSPVRALGLSGNDTSTTSFQPSLACFGDVLRKAGYRQVYMGGAPIVFSNKNMFYRLHGYNQALGLKQLEAAHGGKLPEEGWGLYDRALFKLALERYEKLERRGKPFNLTMITLDTHPPKGRPSPGCPAYKPNSNSMLQAVHCTDYLVGKFIRALKQQPGWKNTVVVIMSDHLMMRNDAEPLYPKGYHRQPALLVLNAGKGVRPARMYHMDIAPTVLHLMGVRTNATFIAGRDRSEPRAPSSKLVDDATDVAVLRKALWSHAQPVALCSRNVLVGAAGDGVKVGGYSAPMSWHGQRRVALRSRGAWLVRIGAHSVHGSVLDEGDGVIAGLLDHQPETDAVMTRSSESYSRATQLGHDTGESILLVQPLNDGDPMRQFSIDWIGKHGGVTHLAVVPRLRKLEVSSPHCSSLLKRMDALPRGKTLDLHKQFKATTAPLYPTLPDNLMFNGNGVRPFQRELGWLRPYPWGSFAVGDYATLGFRLPKKHCHAMNYAFKVHPFIHPRRSVLKVKVLANGKLMATWRFDKHDTTTTWHYVSAPVRTSDTQCRVDLRFVFSRPGALPPPYPKGVDPRPLQLLFLDMHPDPGKQAVAAAH